MYICDECGDSFRRRHHLEDHKLSVHSDERPHVCDKCGDSFKLPHQLNSHIVSVHSDERPHVCDVCGDSFKLPHQLKVHKLTHSNEYPFVCDKCGKTYKQSSHLSSHKKREHSDERPHVCNECGDAFKIKSDLNRHKLVHSNEYPFVCDECDSAFKRLYHLLEHKKKHSDERPHVCDECGASFKRVQYLNIHKEAEACYFTRLTEQIWERICCDIAKILYNGKNWRWKPRILTSEIDNQTFIVPEIVIIHTNDINDSDDSKEIIEFIDAKRSVNACFTLKDIYVYPQVADKVTFWCLYGNADGAFDEFPNHTAVSSNELIELLEKHRTEENGEEIDKLIMQIYLVKQGVDPLNQQLLTHFLDEDN
jgi:predicted nucleic acid-binding Zn ribbon protein